MCACVAWSIGSLEPHALLLDASHRGPVDLQAIFKWCKVATGRLFTSNDPTQITEWGVACLRSLLPIVLEHQDGLPPEMGVWIQDHLVPSLFAGANVGRYHDLTFLLLQGLLRLASTATTTTPTPTPTAPTEAEDKPKKKTTVLVNVCAKHRCFRETALSHTVGTYLHPRWAHICCHMQSPICTCT